MEVIKNTPFPCWGQTLPCKHFRRPAPSRQGTCTKHPLAPNHARTRGRCRQHPTRRLCPSEEPPEIRPPASSLHAGNRTRVRDLCRLLLRDQKHLPGDHPPARARSPQVSAARVLVVVLGLRVPEQHRAVPCRAVPRPRPPAAAFIPRRPPRPAPPRAPPRSAPLPARPGPAGRRCGALRCARRGAEHPSL